MPLSELKSIKAAVKIPVVAIGGINESNARQAMETGIDGISVVSAIFGKKECQKGIRKSAESFIIGVRVLYL